MRQALFSIPPHVPFLPTLVERIVDGTLLADWPQQGPFWLSDITIFLPTQRARAALADQFAARKLGLLPDLRLLGGESEQEELFLPPIDAPMPLPAMSPLQRRLILARLIDAWARTAEGQVVLATPPNAAEILGLADSLAALVDDLEIAGTDLGGLAALNDQKDLADNWQRILKFLDVALRAWPQVLADRGRQDAVVLRNEAIRRRAATLALSFGERPVIVAGSTGTILATADFIKAIASLPRGAVVLPGLDTSCGGSAFEALLRLDQAPHGHAQFGLAKLLRHLGGRPDAVTDLADSSHIRTHIIRSALALPDETAHWQVVRSQLGSELAAGLQGVTVIDARSEDEEARAVALAARESLAQGRSVGIVTPDRTLARRIAAELGRFGLDVDDAAGVPLFQSSAGQLLRSILAAAVEEFSPVSLMSLLSHPAASFGLGHEEIERRAAWIDLGLLRGQRLASGIAGIRTRLNAVLARPDARAPHRITAVEAVAIGEVLDKLDGAISELTSVISSEHLEMESFVGALAGAYAAVTDGSADLVGADVLRQWAGTVLGGGSGLRFAPMHLDGVLAGLMLGVQVPIPGRGRGDIAIWGQLEARLQSPDRLILAGLNEDVWPGTADPGPWLSRGMRIAVGLDPPERRQGQAAHDFELAMGNADVVLAWSRRRGTGPALPSRYVQRLEAFVGKDEWRLLADRGDRFREQALRLDAVTAVTPAPRPSPRPPLDRRPKRLSVTEIETLVRSPYTIYARHILRLRPLEPLGQDPQARERGSMIHEVFADFVIHGHDPSDPGAHEMLMQAARRAFAGLDAIGDRRDIWLKRFSVAADAFLAFERDRSEDIAARHAELGGRWTMPNGFTLTGRADRLDVRRDGTGEIIDFKTGSLPGAGEMKNLEAPQLLLEAAMSGAEGLGSLGPIGISELIYVKVGLGPDAFSPTLFRLPDGWTVDDAVNEVVHRLNGHVAALLLSDARAMLAHVLPANTSWRDDYDHLARADEWRIGGGDG